MALQAIPHSIFPDVTVEIIVQNVNWKVSAVRCVNNSEYAAAADILESGVLVFHAVAPAGQTTQWNVGGVQLGWDSIDGGIIMGDYVMQAQWPATEV